jgi:transposase
MITNSMFNKLKKMYYRENLSIREISRKTGLARSTIRKWLAINPVSKIKFHRLPVAKKLDPFEPWVLCALNYDINLPKCQQRTALMLFKEIQNQGFTGSYSIVSIYVRQWRERTIKLSPDLNKENNHRYKTLLDKQEWMEWMYTVDRQDGYSADQTPSDIQLLLDKLKPATNNPRKKVLAVLANAQGFSANMIAQHLAISRVTVRKYVATFKAGGGTALLENRMRKRKSDNPELKKAIFSLLHEPPSLSGFNRTSWKMEDLQNTLAEKGYSACDVVIRTVIKEAGYRWRSAKVVLTSNDPEYNEKLKHVQGILSELKEDERFFSIDEFGPFAVKMKPGRLLAEPGNYPSVPQWQKSKGCLIVTAALELSTNQVTHFYSTAKNTTEMIRIAKVLIEEYKAASKLYLSWDAASWHMSKEVLAFVEKHNNDCIGLFPRLELAPLPASAQFLNVIESVFSGMARAIIHNSDYASVHAAKDAIDLYFKERNQHYIINPKRAGKKIWGLERTSIEFSAGNNCKDPAYR